jgi:4-hydroxymandelate oxidase
MLNVPSSRTTVPKAAQVVRAEDLQARARAVLPQVAYDYFAGGAEDEATISGNRAAYQRYRFRFHVLTATAAPDLSGEVLGQRFSMPLHLAPVAMQRLAHPEGELAAARAAADAGVIYCLSTLSSVSIEDVAAVSTGPRWFQLYVYEDRGLTGELIDRAGASGYSAVLMTVDTPVLGRRERDLRNGFSLPPGVGYQNFTGPVSQTTRVETGASGLARFFQALVHPTLSVKDLEWVIKRSLVPVIVKGVVRGDDAKRLVDAGAAGVIVSNHGGRQLDYSIASLDALPEVVQAVQDRVPVLVDGGVRRGTDVLKAFALGAKGVLIGRPLLWALAIGGEDGVRSLLEQFRAELTTSMTLLGASRPAELTPDLLVRD